jgi:hypothetical protein
MTASETNMEKILLRFLTFIIGVAYAAQLQAATIMVDATSDDVVGQSLVYQLKDQINRSSMYKLVYSENDAGFVIHIVTIKESDGNQTAYSAVLSMPQLSKKGFNYYITNQVGFCGASVTESCASRILSGFDQPMTDVITGIAEALKKNSTPSK